MRLECLSCRSTSSSQAAERDEYGDRWAYCLTCHDWTEHIETERGETCR